MEDDTLRSLTFHRPGGDPISSYQDKVSQTTRSGGNTTLKVKLAECVSQVDEAYGDARFEPLTRALEILGSINAEQELDVLREQWRDVDGMVDAVVEVHHEGFNTSLQNYSKIMQLLSEAQHYMHAVRKNLMLAQDNLRVDSRNLLEAYHKHAVVSEMVKMIQQVQGMCQSLEQVDALDRDGDWNAAVKVLLQSSNVLAREEIVAIPGVKGLVPKVQQRSRVLLEQIVQHVEGHAFRGIGASGHSRAWHQTSVSRRKSRISRGSGFFGSGSGSAMRFVKFHSIVEDLQALDGKLRHARSPSVPIEGHMVDTGFGLSSSAISCIAQLGGVSRALKSVRAISRQKIRDAIVQTVNQKLSTDGVDSSMTSSDKSKLLLQKVLMRCESIFRGVSKYMRQLIHAKVSAPSAGLSLLCGGEDADAAYFDGQPGSVIADAEIHVLWENVQREVLYVVAAVLGLSVPQSEVDSDELFIDMYWHTSRDVDTVSPLYVSRRKSIDVRKTSLKYSLEEQLSEMSDEVVSKAKTEGFSPLELEHLVKNAVGEEHCVVSSAPCLYNPINNFVLKCAKILDEVRREKERVEEMPSLAKSGSPGLLHSLYPRQISQSGKKAISDNVHLLSSYIADILRMDFVPSVYTDCGHRTQDLIAGLDNIPTYTRVHEADAASVLPAAEAAVQLIRDMLKWSSLASIVAPNITGVLGNCLGKIVDSLQSRAQAVCSHSLAIKLSQDANLVHLMAQEPIAMLVGGPEWFASAKSDAMESFLTSAIASGFAQGKTAFPKSLVDAFLQVRPVSKDSLILQQNVDMKSIVSLAFLGNSADYIADGIYETVGSFVETMPTGRIIGEKLKSVSSSSDKGTLSIDHELVVGLLHIADRFRSVSGMCTRTLRIEAMLHVLYAMQEIFNPSQRVFDERIAMMAPKLASMDEVLAGYLLPTRREYIFAPLPGFCMKLAIYQLNEMDTIDSATVSKVCRALTGVEPVLGSLGLQTQQASKSFAMQTITGIKPLHLAKKYYSLAVGGLDSIAQALEEEKKKGAITHDEWLVLSTL